MQAQQYHKLFINILQNNKIKKKIEMNKIKLMTLFFYCMFLSNCSKKINKENNNKIEKNWDDLSDINLKMKGVVYFVNNKIGNGYHGRGIVRINLIESNLKSYDPRNKQLNYYCIVNNGKAELYDNHVSYAEIGDTIEINTNEKTIKWLNKEKSNLIYSLSIGEIQFFDFIKENKHQVF
jgi:hypothetical protein